MSELIALKNIKKRYRSGDSEILALNDISLHISKGEFITITGKSGSGKSTLMNILGCLDFPEFGSYFLDGINVKQLSDQQLSEIRNREIGFIFQGFNLVPSLNALENTELPLTYRRVSKRQRRQIALEALHMVGLSNRITHRPSQMSGGQQQRVAIARAIAAQPQVLLADEPTGNLDSESGREVLDTLIRLNESGRTVIIITHDEEVARLSRRQVTISCGSISTDTIRSMRFPVH